MITMGMQRLGERLTDGTKRSDLGFLFAPGLDLVADVLPHFWLGGGLRVGVAFMNNGASDLSWSSRGADVYLAFLVTSGLRF